jgi:N-methylhydantoinase A
MMQMLGVDIGGTFTDCVIVDDDATVSIHKRPSTPANPAEGFMLAVGEAAVRVETLRKVVHGTTVAANTLIQRNGATTGLITTKGFRDVLELARSSKPPSDYFNLRWMAPAPLVPRNLRKEVQERVSAAGEIIDELDEEGCREAVHELVTAGCTAVAVCLLFSYVSPGHELRIGEIITELYPELTVSLSSQILPQWKEYERTSTTVVDAFVKPRMASYLNQLRDGMNERGFGRDLLLMKSNAGLMTATAAAETPVHTVLSGPAAAALAGRHIALAAGWENAITMDMGGTSFDVSLVSGGELPYAIEAEATPGAPVLIPTVDIRTIGAGGGSIAWIDLGGGLKVGPDSAGAVPGPACYQNGGGKPTVTDANLLLGRLGVGSPLAGGLTLDATRARDALQPLAEELGLDLQEAANGVIEICVNNMANETRSISAQRGFDPREFVLVAAGGAGPLHAALIAESLAIETVLVPPRPGLLSASGLLLAAPKVDVVRSSRAVLERTDSASLRATLLAMIVQARTMMEEEGFGTDLIVETAVDARYTGQNWEITVPVDPDDLETVHIARRFDVEHERLYGVSAPDSKHEVINLRVTVTAPEGDPARWLPGPDRDPEPSGLPEARRPVYDKRHGGVVGAPVYRRSALSDEAHLEGPCVIEQTDATTYVPSAWSVTVDAGGNLLLKASH